MRLLPALLALALIAGCDGGPDASTYPPAGTFEAVSLGALTDAETGRYNTTAYVTAVNACPEDAVCILPDSIVLATSRAGDGPPQLTLFAQSVRQFEVGRLYEFSVEVNESERGAPYALTLLGYSPR